MSVTERLTSAGYAAAWRLVRLLPEGPLYRTGDGIADRIAARGGRGVERLRANLSRALPAGAGERHLDDVARLAMRSYTRYWLDAFRLPSWSPRRVEDATRVVGAERLGSRLTRGQGVVGALGHLGNWDQAGVWATMRWGPLTTVAERLRPESLYDRFVAYRRRLGIEVLPLDGGPPPLPTLAERVADGGFVPLLADRDLTGRGTEVILLGARARVATGPARLAAATGVPLHPITTWYEPRADLPSGWGLGIEVHPAHHVPDSDPATVNAAMQVCADAWSAAIVAHPADWHMLQRVFTDDLDPARPSDRG